MEIFLASASLIVFVLYLYSRVRAAKKRREERASTTEGDSPNAWRVTRK